VCRTINNPKPVSREISRTESISDALLTKESFSVHAYRRYERGGGEFNWQTVPHSMTNSGRQQNFSRRMCYEFVELQR